MPNITLAVDDETAREMRSHRDIKWSEVARQAIRRKLDELHALDVAFDASEFTEHDIDRMAREANAGLLKRLGPAHR